MVEQPIPRAPAYSETTMHELVLPSHTNALDTAFGGTIMSWVDVCGAICAQRHSQGAVVTAAIDQLNFLFPVHRGDTVRLTGRVTHVGHTSMEVRIIIDVLDNASGKEERSGIAYVTYVAVNDNGKSRPVPPLNLDDPRDQQRFDAGQERREQRLAVRKQKVELNQKDQELI